MVLPENLNEYQISSISLDSGAFELSISLISPNGNDSYIMVFRNISDIRFSKLPEDGVDCSAIFEMKLVKVKSDETLDYLEKFDHQIRFGGKYKNYGDMYHFRIEGDISMEILSRGFALYREN